MSGAGNAEGRTRPVVISWARRHGQAILGFAISVWALLQLKDAFDPEALMRQLAYSNPALLLFCALSIPGTMVFKAIRWRYLFGGSVSPPFNARISSLYIGYLMNTVLPARVGELVRAYLVGRSPGVGTASGVATVVIEKVLDLTTLALLLVAVLLVAPLDSWPTWLGPITYALIGLVGAGLVALAVMLCLRSAVLRLIVASEARVGLIRKLAPARLATSLLDGLAGLGRKDTLPGLLIWSAAIWGGATLTLWSGIAGAGVSIGLLAAVLVLVVTNFGMAVPSAPGYVGVFHGLVVLCLEPFGIERSTALGAALIIHVLIFGNFIIGGLWYLWRGGYSLSGLREESAH